MSGDYPSIVMFVLVTTFYLVEGSNYIDCNVSSNCSSKTNSSPRHLLTKERYERAHTKIHLNSTKSPDEQRSYKRDNTFAEVLKSLLSRVNNAQRKIVALKSPPRAQVKAVAAPAKKPIATVINASNTTSAPIASVSPSATTSPSVSSTYGGSTTGTPGSEATATASGSTLTTLPSPTPTITMTPSTNVSCNSTSGPCTTLKPPVKPSGYNITIAPGVVLTSNGQIVLNPQFPLLIGGSQISGAKPIPGISLGTAQLPGLVSVSSGTATSGQGAAGQQGGPTLK